MQHFSYTVTCAVCTRTGAKQLQILKRFSTQVFASPSRHCMDGKASREEITYPDIVFSIHNYDDLFTDCVVHDSELICVELVARDRLGEFQGVLFLGSVRYEAILDVYQAKSASSFSAYQPSTWFRAPRRVEFLRMRGPRGKGRAEVAVSRAEAAPPTPESELATTLATQNYHQQQLDYPSDEVEAGPRRTRRFSGTNRQQQQQQPHQQFRGSGKPPSRVGSAASLRSWGLSGLMKKSRSDSENVVDATTASSTSAAATVGAVASNAEVESRGIEEELDDQSAGGGIWGQAWHWFKERRRASSIGLSACLTCVSLPWHRIVADLLDSGSQQQPVLAAFEDLPNYCGI
ncbi:hypothetical protein BOX15_Mlig026296g3 [Macrostomum lignano]|uniref:Uncharacterized protein n=1 Tax=Macrostomum lignano TaxID=282301 RepID=A0A267H7D8_9PLAT|nr:hypothetical protein BOX15_Mlig026296g3 [Macrostomum lignano]